MRISISFRLRKCLAPFSDAPGRSLPRIRSPFLGERRSEKPARTRLPLLLSTTYTYIFSSSLKARGGEALA